MVTPTLQPEVQQMLARFNPQQLRHAGRILERLACEKGYGELIKEPPREIGGIPAGLLDWAVLYRVYEGNIDPFHALTALSMLYVLRECQRPQLKNTPPQTAPRWKCWPPLSSGPARISKPSTSIRRNFPEPSRLFGTRTTQIPRDTRLRR